MAPNQAQQQALKSQDTWAAEARDLLRSTLGMTPKTRSKSWPAWSEELWRFVLFSEFVFDLPEPLPDSLKDVPRANEEARPLIEHICDELRSRSAAKDLYIEKAQTIESDLNLPDCCKGIEDFGKKDTFPFEEQTFLRQAITGLLSDNTDRTRELLSRHAVSVWSKRGDSQERWSVIGASLGVIETCDDLDRQLSDHLRNQETLLDFYINSLREADRRQREFEQALNDFLDLSDFMGPWFGRPEAAIGGWLRRSRLLSPGSSMVPDGRPWAGSPTRTCLTGLLRVR